MTNVIPLVATGPPPIDIKEGDDDEFDSFECAHQNGEIQTHDVIEAVHENSLELDSDNANINLKLKLESSPAKEIPVPAVVLSEYLDKVVDGTVNEPIADALSEGRLKILATDNVDADDTSDRYSNSDSEEEPGEDCHSNPVNVLPSSELSSGSNDLGINKTSLSEENDQDEFADFSSEPVTQSNDSTSTPSVILKEDDNDHISTKENDPGFDEYFDKSEPTSNQFNSDNNDEEKANEVAEFSSTIGVEKDSIECEVELDKRKSDSNDDDFADFTSGEEEHTNDVNVTQIYPQVNDVFQNEENNCDEFADFTSCTNNDDGDIPVREKENPNSDDEFAEFSSRPFDTTSSIPAGYDTWATAANSNPSQPDLSFVANFNRESDAESATEDEDDHKFGKRLSQSFDTDQPVTDDASNLEFKKPVDAFSDDDDEFNDFENATSSVPADKKEEQREEEEDDEFDDFASVNTTSDNFPKPQSSSSSESGITPGNDSAQLSSQTNGLLARLLSKLEPLLDRSFTEYEMDTEEEMSHDEMDADEEKEGESSIQKNKSRDITSADIIQTLLHDINGKNSVSKVWLKLGDWDQSIAMNYQWNSSTGYDVFLKSLGIDYRNVLVSSKSGLPNFASQLGLLEPMKPDSHTKNSSDQITQPTSCEAPITTESSAGGDSSSVTIIPPPQFDWSSSGLTNPLDSSNNTVYLDLDFFESLGSGRQHADSAAAACFSPRITHELEAELLSDNNGLPRTEAALSTTSDSVLQRILQKNPASTTLNYGGAHHADGGHKSLSSNPEGSQSINPEVKELLDKMSDLSFMQARVLMFPVRTVDTDVD